MNAFKTVMKILTALAAIAGVIYIIATYGDKIVAWAKNLVENCPCKCKCNCDGECECKCDGGCQCECEGQEAPAEEAAPAEVPAEEIEEVIVEAGEPVADEADFAE